MLAAVTTFALAVPNVSLVGALRVGALYLGPFHHVALVFEGDSPVDTWSLPGANLPAGGSATVELGVALLAVTALAMWLLFRAGRSSAFGERASVRGLSGARVAFGYAPPVVLVALLVRFDEPVELGSFVRAGSASRCPCGRRSCSRSSSPRSRGRRAGSGRGHPRRASAHRRRAPGPCSAAGGGCSWSRSRSRSSGCSWPASCNRTHPSPSRRRRRLGTSARCSTGPGEGRRSSPITSRSRRTRPSGPWWPPRAGATWCGERTRGRPVLPAVPFVRGVERRGGVRERAGGLPGVPGRPGDRDDRRWPMGGIRVGAFGCGLGGGGLGRGGGLRRPDARGMRAVLDHADLRHDRRVRRSRWPPVDRSDPVTGTLFALAWGVGGGALGAATAGFRGWTAGRTRSG